MTGFQWRITILSAVSVISTHNQGELGMLTISQLVALYRHCIKPLRGRAGGIGRPDDLYIRASTAHETMSPTSSLHTLGKSLILRHVNAGQRGPSVGPPSLVTTTRSPDETYPDVPSVPRAYVWAITSLRGHQPRPQLSSHCSRYNCPPPGQRAQLHHSDIRTFDIVPSFVILFDRPQLIRSTIGVH